MLSEISPKAHREELETRLHQSHLREQLLGERLREQDQRANRKEGEGKHLLRHVQRLLNAVHTHMHLPLDFVPASHIEGVTELQEVILNQVGYSTLSSCIPLSSCCMAGLCFVIALERYTGCGEGILLDDRLFEMTCLGFHWLQIGQCL